jgi:hypothetical protein
MTYATTDHIKNTAAATFINGLRKEFSGLNKIYGSRYMVALSIVAKYEVYTRLEDNKVVHVVRVSGVEKVFPSAKDAGIFMEQKIESLFDFGIMV